MEYYNFARDVHTFFKNLPNWTTPEGIVFYNKKDYDDFMKDVNREVINYEKKYPKVSQFIHSDK